tara:strand:+ start:2413 stop:2994 length:582 start_codon:yes stop_codon:yes gene_type:complete
MTSISALKNIHSKGFFGNYKSKKEILKISEIKNLLIVQIAQYKNSSLDLNDIEIDSLKLSNNATSVSKNKDTRILWNGPKNWLLVSNKKNLIETKLRELSESDFAITDLSHSKAIIQLEGESAKEILKKGSPYNFNEMKKDICINSVFNGITITIDMIDDNPNQIRLFALRSFGESLYHSITDACLEDGYEAI